MSEKWSGRVSHNLDVSEIFEFEKGKDAIAINNTDELVLVLRKLIDATDEGEFDAMIAAANKARPIIAKRA